MSVKNIIILFDLDGTLIDSTQAILESFHNSFDIYKQEHPTDKEIKALIGHPLDIMYRELGVDENEIWNYVATYKEHYKKISTQKTVLLKNAKKAIEKAYEFAELGIVTTKTGKYSQVLMEYFGVMDYFDILIGREDVQNPKPHEEPILKALESFDTTNKAVWMIGDTQMDLLSATHAGVNSIGVLSGYDSKETLEKYTDKIFSDALEAIMYLKDTN